MREFFKKELDSLYLKTGLRQHANISAMPKAEEQFTVLFDLLEAECNRFPFMPDADKQAWLLERIMTDGDFQGFNPKIVNKWLREVYVRYIPNQSDYVEINREPASQERADYWIGEWKKALAKIGNPTYQADPNEIKDYRIRLLKEQFRGVECKHVGLRIEISDTEEVCNDCGKTFLKSEKVEPKN